MASIKEGLTIRRLGADEVAGAQALFLLFQEVFEAETPTTAPEPYLKKLLGKPDFFVLAAVHQGETVGGLTAYELPLYHSAYSEMFIYDIAVKPTFQRKGVGKQLLSTLQEYCRQQGIREIFVAANEEDEHAVDFYRATGGDAEKVVHFSYTPANKRSS